MWNGKLIAGSVASGWHDPRRKGDVEVTVCDIAAARTERFTLHRGNAAGAVVCSQNSICKGIDVM